MFETGGIPMLEEGLSYPAQGDEWIGRFAIGGILTFLTFLIIPTFIIYGYFVRVLEYTIDGKTEPPEWEDWGDLLIDGLKGIAVTLVYAFIPLTIFGVIGTVFLVGGASAGGEGGGLFAGLGLITFLLLIPVMFLVYYFVPAALCNMAREDSITAAFDLGMIKQVALTGDYFVAILLPIVVGIVINFITSILAITFVGLILVPFVTFYGQVAIFHMFGIAFRENADGVSSQNTTTAAAV
jgi:hypothetical protein